MTERLLPLKASWAFNISFIAILLLLVNPSYSQHFLRTEGKTIVNEQGDVVLLRGMGLGGWMLQEGYLLQTAEFANAQYKIRNKIESLIGEDRTDLFYTAWLDNHVTEKDIIAMKSWGFNSVRLPMHYNLFTLPIQQEPIAGEHTWLERGFELTDNLLEWCKTHEMYLILDLHAAPGGQGYDQGISDYNPDLPSLWESDLNVDKTVALWRRLAERYKDEQWIGGYDLLNEPNWDFNQNQPLRALYEAVTEVIREVDNRHIIFIEGNWFANDFTGLTPPWDDNMVYSPHKYWSTNDQGSIQWVLDLREQYNIPLYLGESGENSNVWFRDAISLLEEQNVGWAWWPLKKVDDIAGPLSIEKSDGYTELLEFWKGNAAQPDPDVAFEILMDLAAKTNFDQCRIQTDVIDAMFRQQTSEESLPFVDNDIPGIIYATDYDLGPEGSAYQDTESGTYHVSTGNFTAWNNGWRYRNDGVDIEACQDNLNTNGFNVGWIEQDEWLKYTSNVITEGVYDLHIRVASSNDDSSLSIEVDQSKASDVYPVPNTGGFQAWQTMVVPGIILSEGTQEITCQMESGSFNLSHFDFKYVSASNDLAFDISRAVTQDENSILVHLNKTLNLNSILDAQDFILELDSEAVEITSIRYADDSERILIIETSRYLRSDQQIRISHDGNRIRAIDNTNLIRFEKFFVENNLSPILTIPGKIEAEDFAVAEGIQLEDCSDFGQGQNIGYLDAGDYLEYVVDVTESGIYTVNYRVASQTTSGSILLSLLTLSGEVIEIDQPDFPVTGGWQSWETVENEIELTAGQYRLRIDILNAPFNMNWMEFESLIISDPAPLGVFLYPNCTYDLVKFSAQFSIPHEINYWIHDFNGRLIRSDVLPYSESFYEEISLSAYATGVYYFTMELEDGRRYNYKVVKL